MAERTAAERTLQQVAFPKLNDDQIAYIKRFAKCSAFDDGEALFKAGDTDLKFYVIRAGEVEIVECTGDQPKTVTVHHPGEFTGDVSHLTGMPAIVSAFARGRTEVCEICDHSLRRILQENLPLSDVILQAFIARRQLLEGDPNFVGLRVIGSRFSRDTHRIKDFLARHHVPFTFVDLETDEQVQELIKRFQIKPNDTPVVACGNMMILRNPSSDELSDELGVRQRPAQKIYDLVIAGGGPAGLAAAVYGASEGLSTLIIERHAPGGQAASSMRIENYLGFPTGITGAELANRAVLQANKFGATVTSATPAQRLEFDGQLPVLQMDGQTIQSRTLLITTGAEYRRLEADDREKFEGNGVYYAATTVEANVCKDEQVIVVGGGNSAGQAAVFLSSLARKVILLLRGDDLCKNMSAYLAQRLENTDNITIMKNTQITRMLGEDRLRAVEVTNNKTDETRTIDTAGVFSFIGAVPRTDWLNGQLDCDPKGFIKTGLDLVNSPRWTLGRQPFLLETCRPGVFAAGDVRFNSVKRVASAVGEGSMAVQFVHQYLSTIA